VGDDETRTALQERIESLEQFSEEHENLSQLFADAHQLAIDGEGRVILPEKLKEYAHIGSDVAFVGLGAPHWDPYARGTIVGLTRGSGRAQLVRAAVESMAYQTVDVVEAMERDLGSRLEELRVDGGAAVMDVLCQFQADLLGIPVRRPRQTETTALGAAFLAGLGARIWEDADLEDLWKLDREFEPRLSRDEAGALQSRWREAVARSRDWLSLDTIISRP